MEESVERFETGSDKGVEVGVSQIDTDWVGDYAENAIVNPKEGNEEMFNKLTELHSGVSQDAEIAAATIKVQAKLDDLKSSLA